MYFYLTMGLFDAIELPPYEFLFCRHYNEKGQLFIHMFIPILTFMFN